MSGGFKMSNETEKLTINLGIVELAQIDVLVEQGIYSNRSDLIRTAIRKQLETHEDKIERAVTPITGAKQGSGIWGIGIIYLNKGGLEDAFENNGNRPIKINVVGMLKISNDISSELFQKTVARVSVKGKLVALPKIKSIIEEMN